MKHYNLFDSITGLFLIKGDIFDGSYLRQTNIERVSPKTIIVSKQTEYLLIRTKED